MRNRIATVKYFFLASNQMILKRVISMWYIQYINHRMNMTIFTLFSASVLRKFFVLRLIGQFSDAKNKQNVYKIIDNPN